MTNRRVRHSGAHCARRTGLSHPGPRGGVAGGGQLGSEGQARWLMSTLDSGPVTGIFLTCIHHLQEL